MDFKKASVDNDNSEAKYNTLHFVTTLSLYNDFRDEMVNMDRIRFEMMAAQTGKVVSMAVSKEKGDAISDEEVAQLRKLHAHKSYDKYTNSALSNAFASLGLLPHKPVTCPIGKCKATIGATAMLSHYLHNHTKDHVQSVVLHRFKRCVLLFDPSRYEFGENRCLGLLVYGGIKELPFDLPAKRGICKQNSFLPEPYDHLESHLPIAIVACRASWCALLQDKKDEAQITDPENKSQQLVVIWLASMQTTKTISCTLTIFSKMMTTSRSAIVMVRRLSDSQNPSEFLRQDQNSIQLTQPELNLLTAGGSEDLFLEISINEYD